MANTSQKRPKDFISSLYINGLQGRMLYIPSTSDKKREMLYVYGHHSSLERFWGITEDLSQYGPVTMPDLPGFGGMDSFYKIGQEASLDNLADYLASFIKLRYKRKTITIIGLSLGFVVATRMLQRNPELVKKVDLLVSAVGFTHHDDFKFSKTRYRAYLNLSRFFKHPLPAIFFKNVVLNPLFLRMAYSKTHNAKDKFIGYSKSEQLAIMKHEIHLWHVNDVRTHMATAVEFLTLNNCQKKIKLPVWHISVKADRYFNHHGVEQHMRIIFEDFHEVKSEMDSHGPSMIQTKEEAEPFMPGKLRKLLSEPV